MADPAKIRRTGAAVASSRRPPTPAPEPEEKKSDLASSAEQFRILNPETLEYSLHLERGDRTIELPTQFTIHDIHSRRIFDDLESLASVLIVELRKLEPTFGSAEVADPRRQAENNLLMAAAASKGRVREATRELVVKLAKYREPILEQPGPNAPVGSQPYERHKPTIEEVTLGMASRDVDVATLFFFNRAMEEQRKNAQRTTKAIS